MQISHNAIEFDFLKELSLIEGEKIGINTKSPILDPKIDLVFKAIFAQNTKESEIARKDFLSSILDCEVIKADLIQNELPVSDINEKALRFDMLIKLQNDEEVNVEIQLKNSDDMLSRSEYYVSKVFSTQEAKGKVYADLHKAYQISILNFTLFDDRESFIDEYQYRNPEGKLLSGNTKIIFLELSKMKQLLDKPINELTPAQMWALFLKYANDEKQKALIHQIEDSREGIAMALNILDSVSNNRAVQLDYIMKLKHETDEISQLIYAQRKGMAEGMAQGISIGEQRGISIGEQRGISIGEQRGISIGEQRGISIGEYRAKVAFIKKLAAKNYTVKEIAEIEDMPEIEVRNILEAPDIKD